MLDSSGGSLVETACPLGFTSDRGARRGLPVRDDAFGSFPNLPSLEGQDCSRSSQAPETGMRISPNAASASHALRKQPQSLSAQGAAEQAPAPRSCRAPARTPTPAPPTPRATTSGRTSTPAAARSASAATAAPATTPTAARTTPVPTKSRSGTARGRLSALRTSRSKPGLYGASVWAAGAARPSQRRALHGGSGRAQCYDQPAPATGFDCGPCPEGAEGDGLHCAASVRPRPTPPLPAARAPNSASSCPSAHRAAFRVRLHP